MNLLLVETPAQAKRLSELLGSGWRVEACHGWLRDLPTDRLGIDVKASFRPTFVIPHGKAAVLRRLLKAIQTAEAVYLATPPTRHGEAMAWHALALSPDLEGKPVYRLMLDALTQEALHIALATPRPLDLQQVEAAISQRLLEHGLGMALSKRLSTRLGKRTRLTAHAGVLLMLMQRAASRVPSWSAQMRFADGQGRPFTAILHHPSGGPIRFSQRERFERVQHPLREAVYTVEHITRGRRRVAPPDALTLPDLIAASHQETGATPERTLHLIQALHTLGWVTHPNAPASVERSARVSADLLREYGADYLPEAPRTVGGIAPTDLDRLPDAVSGEVASVYRLVWRHLHAAHMAPAIERAVTVRLRATHPDGQPVYPLSAQWGASHVYFDGWRRVMGEGQPLETVLDPPLVQDGQRVTLLDLHAQPTPVTPLTEVGLIGQAAGMGIAPHEAISALTALRPSGWVDDAWHPTEDGLAVLALVGDWLSPDLWRQRADALDRVASGELDRLTVLSEGWAEFGALLRPHTPKRKELL